MKNFSSIGSGLLSLAALLVVVPGAQGQDVISAMSGYIYFAAGGVLLDEQPFEFDAAKFVHVGDGQRLSTAQGWAEIMITPGSFVRLAPNSELEMVRAGTLAARMRLTEGTVAVDLSSAVDTEGIALDTGEAQVRFVKSGLYRLDFPAGGNPVVRVVRGKARVEVYGRKIDVGGKQQLTVAPPREKLKANKIGKLEEDDLDRWNAQRHDLLAAESRKRNRDPDSGLVSRKAPPPSDCRACRVAPGRDPKTQPRTRPPGYPLVQLSGDWP